MLVGMAFMIWGLEVEIGIRGEDAQTCSPEQAVQPRLPGFSLSLGQTLANKQMLVIAVGTYLHQ